jgi:hypothetical protein
MPEAAKKKTRGRKPKKIIEDDDIDTEINENKSSNIDNVLAKITQDAEEILNNEKQEEEALPKKRGRKPKNKIFDHKPKDEEPKKRGRKPKNNYGIVEKKKEVTSKTEDFIILQLPIRSKDLTEVEFTGDKILTYSDKINPDPTGFISSDKYKEFDNGDIETQQIVNITDTIQNLPPSVPDLFENNITKIVKEKAKPVDFTKQDLHRRWENIKERKAGYNYENRQARQVKLMVQFQEANKRNEWPKNTKIHCFWCCHSFEGIPWAIPFKYINDVFHVDGNFCSPECAAAYNFEQKDFNMWERYMLLNLLYNKVNYPRYQKLKLAPPKRMLVEYGGNMTIDDFRRYCHNYSKDYIVNFPPMISIPTIAEEINLSDHFRQKIVYMDKDRIEDATRRCQEQEKKLMDDDESLINCFKRIDTQV